MMAWPCNWKSLFKQAVKSPPSSVSLPVTETCSVKGCMDANVSLKISVSAGFMQMLKLIPPLSCFWMIKVKHYLYLQNAEDLKVQMWWVFSFSFCRVMHVLSLCICYRKGKDRNKLLKIILVLQKNKFVFQLVPTGTPMKVPMFTRLQKRFSDTLKWTHKQAFWHVMFFSFFSGFLSASLSFSPLHGQNLNL